MVLEADQRAAVERNLREVTELRDAVMVALTDAQVIAERLARIDECLKNFQREWMETLGPSATVDIRRSSMSTGR